MVFNKLVKM